MAITSNSPSSSAYYERDCREIHTALDRPGLLGRALAGRTLGERQQIKANYKAIYGKDLIERLHDDREAPICAALYLWMLDPQERDAVVARDALERSEPDYRALVEMYARRKSNQLFFMRQAYLNKFKTHLDQDIVSDSSHPYQRILAALATSHRSHHDDVSQHIAKCDAMKLYGAMKTSTGGIDEATVLEIFSKRSIPQLRLAFSSYKQIYGRDFIKTLEQGSRGEFGESLGVVIQCMCDPFEYYSQMVFDSLKGGAAAKRVLTRVVMGSSEAGMERVNAVFEQRYGMKIQDAIRESTHDRDYRDFLLALTDVKSSS